MLKTSNHDRDVAGMQYVYPVVSRRAGGVSIGINLNINNACNWRCIYCQVPDLKLGSAPPVDLSKLEIELRTFLHELLHGDYMEQHVPEQFRRVNDIALSGNGEPTSSEDFSKVVEMVADLMAEMQFPDPVKLILITNGSLLYRENVQLGLRRMAESNGEIWYKIDRASEAGMNLVNQTRTQISKVRDNLCIALDLCPTWIQTCWFKIDSMEPSRHDEDEYLHFLESILQLNRQPQGVLLYSLARPSMQPEAPRLEGMTQVRLEKFAERIRELGLRVKVNQ